jgi:hypothetical protein
MRVKKIYLITVVLALASGCTLSGPSGPQTYENAAFLFQYPESWQTMAKLWGDRYQPGKEYYRLGVSEIITVTSVQKQGESGAWFAVASTPLSGAIDLAYIVNQTYAPFMDELRDYSIDSVTVAGTDGFQVTYRRPWGEPWWQFRDVWLANDSTLYLLSFHAASLDKYQQDVDFILNNFSFK